ncbi:MAG: tetratricopeptide repeat protein, partial [Planctomycetes bacterium]|nr:tetratricopeptide repeat protein [Planctomycetota bacterium]
MSSGKWQAKEGRGLSERPCGWPDQSARGTRQAARVARPSSLAPRPFALVRVLFGAAIVLGFCAAGGWASGATLAARYQDAWYQENGLHDLGQAAELYRSVATAGAVEPSLAAKALLRLGACRRELGDPEGASRAELEARRRFPEEMKHFPTHRLEVLDKQLDEAFNVADAASAARAIVRFLSDLDVAVVHSICEWCYAQAHERRATAPLASIPALRKAIAISTYLRQIERSAFAQKDIGDIYAAAARFDEAIAAYRKVQEDFAEAKGVGAWAQLGIAEVQRLRGRLPEAVEAYRAVERDYPGQLAQAIWANLWMGDAFRVAGKTADAQATWRRVLEEFNEPGYADLLAIAARLLGQAG